MIKRLIWLSVFVGVVGLCSLQVEAAESSGTVAAAQTA